MLDTVVYTYKWSHIVFFLTQPLPEGVGGFELYWDVMFLEDSFEFFWNYRQKQDRNVVIFISIVFFLGVWFWRRSSLTSNTFSVLFCGVPVPPFSPGFGGYFFGPMLLSFDYPQVVPVRSVNQNGGTGRCVLVSCKPEFLGFCLLTFWQVQEGQSLFVYILCKFNIYLFWFFCLNLDPDVIYVSQPVAWACAWEGLKGSVFHLFLVEVGNYRGNCGTHGTTMFLPVEALSILEVGSVQAEVHHRADLGWW